MSLWIGITFSYCRWRKQDIEKLNDQMISQICLSCRQDFWLQILLSQLWCLTAFGSICPSIIKYLCVYAAKFALGSLYAFRICVLVFVAVIGNTFFPCIIISHNWYQDYINFIKWTWFSGLLIILPDYMVLLKFCGTYCTQMCESPVLELCLVYFYMMLIKEEYKVNFKIKWSKWI